MANPTRSTAINANTTIHWRVARRLALVMPGRCALRAVGLPFGSERRRCAAVMNGEPGGPGLLFPLNRPESPVEQRGRRPP